ncbi:substrate-binding domain-containing protein [Cognatiyoonia koreensis]|uniref:substrate-binding domain-containing protein n=1 Tax=Cognatiyoonia koreensis TaxID=364200 RepID=UPI001F603286|nr:phosphate ABC transporter substrate-binding/OmpA family protein [Cognatiyoonia koreensis]
MTSANGNLTLTGRFIGYDGTYLQMESPYGPLTVRYGDMTCTGDDCPDPDSFVPTIRLSGASRMAEILLPGLIEGFGRSMGYRVAFAQIDSTHATLSLFQDDDHVADFTIRSSTTDEGFADLIAHEADLVMSVREVRESEVAVADGLGIGRLDDGRQSRIVALDGLVPIVAPGRNVPGISLRDLSRVYTGGIRDWTEVGGAPGRITVNLMDPSSGLAQGFLDSVVARMNRPLTEDVRYHATLADLVAAVAEDPNALGIVPWGKAVFAQQLALTDQCGFSLLPRAETLKAEDYPLTMPLFLYLPQRRQAPILREFLTWLRTPESQLVVRRSGFVDPGPVPIPLADQGQRFATAITLAGDEIPLEELQRMVAIMKPRTRLSTTFRFEAGSSRLDAQSRSGLLDLAQSLRKGRYEGRSIMLIGFSDGRGDANANRLLSEERAESVKRALVTLIGDVRDTVTIDTEAFGEALPMGCDDTSWGRELNRRVELWVD